MATGSTLYRFAIDLSDVDRGVYEALDFRVALHPSETPQFLVLRVLAYVLNFREGIEFSPGGISDTDEPAIRAVAQDGSQATLLWIEIGKPSPRKLHKATKAAREVKIYTHRNAAAIAEEIAREGVHQAERIELYSLEPAFLERLALRLARANAWSVLSHDGTLTVGVGDATETAQLTRHGVSS